MSNRVLVPIDGSPPSGRALTHTFETYPDAAITVVHVIDPSNSVVVAEEAGPTVAEDWFERARRDADDILERARDLASDHGIDVETETEVGRPAATILTVATDGEFDHVVIGSHGRSGASRLLLGSVAERVLRRAEVPVTVVRAED